MEILISTLLGYLIGSIPFSFIIGKIKGVDIRKTGTGNVGGSNVGRTLGFKYGLLAFFLDFSKGIAAVLIPRFLGYDISYSFLSGFFSSIGHSFPVFLKFQGGRGIATSLGFLFALFPKETIVFLLIFVPLVFLKEIALYILFFVISISIYLFIKFRELSVLPFIFLLFILFRRVQFVVNDLKEGRSFFKSFLNRLLFDAPERKKLGFLKPGDEK